MFYAPNPAKWSDYYCPHGWVCDGGYFNEMEPDFAFGLTTGIENGPGKRFRKKAGFRVDVRGGHWDRYLNGDLYPFSYAIGKCDIYTWTIYGSAGVRVVSGFDLHLTAAETGVLATSQEIPDLNTHLRFRFGAGIGYTFSRK